MSRTTKIRRRNKKARLDDRSVSYGGKRIAEEQKWSVIQGITQKTIKSNQIKQITGYQRWSTGVLFILRQGYHCQNWQSQRIVDENTRTTMTPSGKGGLTITQTEAAIKTLKRITTFPDQTRYTEKLLNYLRQNVKYVCIIINMNVYPIIVCSLYTYIFILLCDNWTCNKCPFDLYFWVEKRTKVKRKNVEFYFIYVETALTIVDSLLPTFIPILKKRTQLNAQTKE